MKGRKPLPIELLEHRKGKLYDQQAARKEIMPKPVKRLTPKVPRGFDKEHRQQWNRIRAVLKNYGIMNAGSEIDMHILVVSYIKWQKYEDENKVNEAQKYLSAVFRAKANLGLSNSDMARLGSLAVAAQKRKSEMEALLD